MPFSVFDNRNRLMTFISLFLGGRGDVDADGDDRASGEGRTRLPGAEGGHPLHTLRHPFGSVMRGGGAAPHVAPRWLLIVGGLFVVGAMLLGRR